MIRETPNQQITLIGHRRFHLVIDARNCDLKLITDKKLLEKALREIVRLCRMKILHGPVIIDYSHISMHTFTDSREIYIDIFSCKAFDKNKVKSFLKKFFRLKAKDMRATVVHHQK